MSGNNNFLVDTNILIYCLEERLEVYPYLDATFWISDITQIELLGVKNISNEAKTICTNLIDACIIVSFNDKIKDIAIELKQKYSIKVPDALIAATALYLQFPLLTADKGF